MHIIGLGPVRQRVKPQIGVCKVIKVKENLFLIVTLGSGIALELILLASQWNQQNRLPGNEIGAWAIRMGSHWTTTVSWTVAILIALAFIDVIGESNWFGTGVLLGGTLLTELLFGHVLPNPQNDKTFAIAFTAGVVGLAIKLRSRKGESNNALGWITSRRWGGTRTT